MAKGGQMYTQIRWASSLLTLLPLFSGTQMGSAGWSLASGDLNPAASISKPLTDATVDKLQWAVWTVLLLRAFLLVGKTGDTA